MRLASWTIGGLTALVALVLSVANRHVIVVNAWPDLTAYGAAPAPRYEAPLFAVALAVGAVGFVLGALREFLRERRHRVGAARQGRRIAELEREIASLRGGAAPDPDDEIIALGARSR